MTMTLERTHTGKIPPRIHPAGSLLAEYCRVVRDAYGQQRRDRYGDMDLPPEAYESISNAFDRVANALAARWRLKYMRKQVRFHAVLNRHRRRIAREFHAA